AISCNAVELLPQPNTQEETDPGAKMFRIRCDFDESLCTFQAASACRLPQCTRSNQISVRVKSTRITVSTIKNVLLNATLNVVVSMLNRWRLVSTGAQTSNATTKIISNSA